MNTGGFEGFPTQENEPTHGPLGPYHLARNTSKALDLAQRAKSQHSLGRSKPAAAGGLHDEQIAGINLILIIALVFHAGAVHPFNPFLPDLAR